MMHAAKGFTLIEAVISLTIAGLVVASAISTYRVAQLQQRDQKGEWIAFTVAQQQMELLGSMPKESISLDDDTGDGISAALFGTKDDANCDVGVDGSLTADMKVNETGRADASGNYLLCWKVTDGSPQGTLKNIRVIGGYGPPGDRSYVLLQVIR